MKHDFHLTLGLLGATLLAAAMVACAPATATRTGTQLSCDAEAAKALAHKDRCMRCHNMTKPKLGPTYSEMAVKYQSIPDADDVLYKHLTTGEAAMMSDGTELYHKNIADHSPEKVRNMVCWILRH